MKKRLAIPLLAVALGGAGCMVDNTSSVQVFEICSFTEECVFDAECETGILGHIELDVSGQSHLWLVLQVNNQRPTSGDVDTADAFLQEFETEYEAVPGIITPPTRGNISTTPVPSNGSSTVAVQPITAALGTQLLAQIPASTPAAPTYVDLVAKLRLKGVYGDGSSFETGDFRIQVKVCNGCLDVLCSPDKAITCPPGSPAQVPRQDAGVCAP